MFEWHRSHKTKTIMRTNTKNTTQHQQSIQVGLTRYSRKSLLKNIFRAP